MPIHLPPLSRRGFLRRSLLAGAGLAVGPELFAAGHDSDANAWALLADTHIAADPKRIERAINMTDHLKAVSQEVLARPERPAGVFIVGDCAFSKGEPGDYAALTGLLEPLRGGGLPLHLALGNHDQRENFWAALEAKRAAKRPVADKQVALVRSPLVNWFLLDSLEQTLVTPGSLGAAQLAWLAEALDANRDKPAVILIHHNPGTAESIRGLKDTEELFQVIRPRSQVKAFIFGHTHNWKVTADSSGIHLINLPPVAYAFLASNPAGWVHATARQDGLKLELRCIDATHKEHGRIVDLKWRPA
ncbi:MAG: metallophosphoesterase [Verrucomicrobiota bacterium]|nr:metallophosphoesterase [Verrucomicrobiota bacterium]MCC6821700.1 metallophosphoesterase [Limisphaerales bacterium]